MNLQLAQNNWLKPLQRLLGIGLKVNVVAIHSKATHLPPSLLESWYEDSIVWLRELGQESLSLSFIGVKGFDDADTYAFAKADKKLRRLGFSKIPYLSVYAALPAGMDSLSPRFSASLSNSQVPGIASTCVWAWEDMGPEMTKNVFLKQCKWARSVGILDYALVLQQSSRLLPEVEAIRGPSAQRLVVNWGGVTGSGYSTKKISDSGGHTINYLRDIYPIQLLSVVHLSHRMGDVTLKEWIESSPNYGVLTPFSNEHWVWEIPANKEKAVRKALSENNLLTLYLPDMSRIYEDYGRLRN